MEEKKLIVTFKSTIDAIQMEKVCNDNGVDGRLIPVPGDISAGCGMAWTAPYCKRDEIAKVMKKAKIAYEAFYERMQ